MTARSTLRVTVATLVAALVLAAGACGDDDAGGGDDDAMVDARDYLDDELPATIASVLYDHEATRDHYLDLAAENAPDLEAEITADGEVTLDEFRSIPDVQDAVNSVTGDFLGGFQQAMGGTEPADDG